MRKVDKLSGHIDLDGEKKSDKIVGYFCYIEQLNGFSKTLYVSVEDMASYAKRYSPSIPKNTTIEMLIAKANDGIVSKKVGWEGNFNDMALKTVIRRLLSKYGYLTVEMENAVSRDEEVTELRSRNDIIEENANKKTISIEAINVEEVDTETGEIKETSKDKKKEAPDY